MIRFILLVNKQGQTRVSQYHEYKEVTARAVDEAEIIRKCLARNEKQCSIIEHHGIKLVYRKYASLYFIVGVDQIEVCPNSTNYTTNEQTANEASKMAMTATRPISLFILFISLLYLSLFIFLSSPAPAPSRSASSLGIFPNRTNSASSSLFI